MICVIWCYGTLSLSFVFSVCITILSCLNAISLWFIYYLRHLVMIQFIWRIICCCKVPTLSYLCSSQSVPTCMLRPFVKFLHLLCKQKYHIILLYFHKRSRNLGFSLKFNFCRGFLFQYWLNTNFSLYFTEFLPWMVCWFTAFTVGPVH